MRRRIRIALFKMEVSKWDKEEGRGRKKEQEGCDEKG